MCIFFHKLFICNLSTPQNRNFLRIVQIPAISIKECIQFFSYARFNFSFAFALRFTYCKFCFASCLYIYSIQQRWYTELFVSHDQNI